LAICKLLLSIRSLRFEYNPASARGVKGPWHGRIAVHGAFLAFWIGWFILSVVLAAIAHLFAIITFPISLLIGLGALILMIKAYGNESFKLPVIGEWAEKRVNG
jgi:uncharacterized membrane protein